MDNKPTVFLFNDTQALDESFLEDIGNILSSGEVPNLYKPEEFEEVCEESFPFECWRGRLDETEMIISIGRMFYSLFMQVCHWRICCPWLRVIFSWRS